MEKTSGGITNGPFAGTTWIGCICHIRSGTNAGKDEEIDSNNRIIINDDTTTLQGSIWGNDEGTHSSSYSENNPGLTVPTKPRIFVSINNSKIIVIINNTHNEYGEIMQVNTKIHDEVTLYFSPEKLK
jgi:hypothetical protein